MSKWKEIYHEKLIRFTKRTFPFWEKLGFHVTPCHFYEPVPIISKLKEDIWERESSLLGISMNEEYQIEFLRRVCPQYKKEYDLFGLYKAEGDCPYFVYNGGFGEVDGDILYCMIRYFKPRRIIEVGSGWSTLLSAYALKKNAKELGSTFELISIEPYPRPFLKDSNIGISKLIEREVQTVDFDLFASLEENDILFLDSTHVVAIASDVCFEILEILPRLKGGVLVHFHDIFLPYEYPKHWVKDMRIFWNEAYLLQAFLMYNNAFEIIWAGNWMKTKHRELCSKIFRSEASQSLWVRKAI